MSSQKPKKIKKRKPLTREQLRPKVKNPYHSRFGNTKPSPEFLADPTKGYTKIK